MYFEMGTNTSTLRSESIYSKGVESQCENEMSSIDFYSNNTSTEGLIDDNKKENQMTDF